jgi:lipopolysaccharide/colanic/teichoic acid biosynthesis glycosyltransferase
MSQQDLLRPRARLTAVRHPAASRLAKRLFDIAVSGTLLLAALPVLAAVSVLVRLSGPGPVLFRQIRLGKHRRPFVLYKFRTMHAGSDDTVHREYVRKLLTEDEPPASGARGLYKLENDIRITPLGRILRRTSLDELPQLINVIRGDMSLVGPRPALPWEAEHMTEAHHQRYAVPPGLTGLWQVSGRNSLTMRQGLELDLDYVRRQSFALDLVILLKTVPTVLLTRGAL